MVYTLRVNRIRMVVQNCEPQLSQVLDGEDGPVDVFSQNRYV